MFSLEALMKANQTPSKADGGSDDASNQLWNMQSAEPLFGTAADEALLTTPFKAEPAQSMDSMTLPSETPNARRWWPIALAASAGLALAAGGIWVFGSGAASSASAASEQAKLEAQAAVPPPAVLPAPGTLEPAAAPGDDGQPSGEPASSAAVANAADSEGSPSEATVAAAGLAAPGLVQPSGLSEGAVTTGPGAVPGAVAKAAEPARDSAKENAKDKPSSRKPPARAVPTRAPTPASSAVSSKALIPFDKAAAKTALNTAASQSASCGAGGAPGKGKIQVTFATNGKVSDAQLVEGPFAGSTAGKCALRHFRAAKVPAFAGSPVTVAKSFKVD